MFEKMKIADYSILVYALLHNFIITNSVSSGVNPNNAKSTQAISTANKVAAGYLLAEQTDALLNLTDRKDRLITNVIRRVGPDMRPSRGYKDWPEIDLNVSMRAWNLLHHHASVGLNNYVELAKPAIEELVFASNVSSECFAAIRSTLDGIRRLDSWAVKMANSWGAFPPSGIFEGTYSSVGSYHTCVNIDPNHLIGHAHYCSLSFRPIMPARRDFELVVTKEPEELLNMFEVNRTDTDGGRFRDAFTDVLQHSQYYHYVYYKWGTCWPINCSPLDIKRVAREIAIRNVLMHGPVKCYSNNATDYEDISIILNDKSDNRTNVVQRKLVVSVWDKNDGIFVWKPMVLPIQRVAYAILISISIFIFTMTLIDIICNRISYLYHRMKMAMKATRIEPLPTNRPEYLSDPRLRKNNRIGGRSHDRSAQILPTTRKYNAIAIGSQVYSRTEMNEFKSDVTHVESENVTDGPQVPVISDATNISQTNQHHNHSLHETARPQNKLTTFMGYVDDFSIISNAKQFFFVKTKTSSDILCLDGIRCLTMVWVILTHTAVFNDWSAWSRTKEVERSVKSLFNQPLFNGTYLVDTFFLMSGLLSSFTVFRHSRNDSKRFNPIVFVVGRWLRLTPQIFLVSLILIIFPTLSCGPHWFPIVGEFSENCLDNWWINLLHIQAFYKMDRMCNFVTWWISIDFLYHLMAIFIIMAFLKGGHRLGLTSLLITIVLNVAWQVYRHYQLSLPPNILSTIPLTGAMWNTMTLEFFWTPYAHSVPFFLGFYLGYLMALKRNLVLKHLNTRVAMFGWILSISLLILQGYSTYWWVCGAANYTKLVSTVFFTICPIVWASSYCWIILACHHGYGGCIDKFLSANLFVILGKSSYIIYLSHFHVLFMFFGQQNLLLEPSALNLSYIIMGNILVSTVYGIILCVIYEIPWLKMQRRLMRLL